jgi:hypothetical protein
LYQLQRCANDGGRPHQQQQQRATNNIIHNNTNTTATTSATTTSSPRATRQTISANQQGLQDAGKFPCT